MSPRSDSRPNKFSRSGRSSASYRNSGGESGRRRRPSSDSPNRSRGDYRSKREGGRFDSSSESSEDGNYQRRGRFSRDRRDGAIPTRGGSILSNKSSKRNQQEGQSFRRREIQRRVNPYRETNPLAEMNREDSSRPDSGAFSFQSEKDHGEEATSIDMVWGRHSTQAVLEAGRPIHRIWCTPEIRSSPRFLQLLRDAKSSGVLVEEITWARLGQLTNGGVHQGIALQTAAAETLDLESLIGGCKGLGETPLLLALDGLKDPQNLGAIVRSAEALGAHGLVLPQRRSAGLTGSVAKVAAGALEHLPVARVVNLNRSLEKLKQEGYRVIGLAEEGDLTLSEVDLEGPLVVVTGSEDKGISLVTRRHCDQLVRIPLRGVTNSLNASVATAVVLYEVARRGWMKGLSGQAPSPRMVRAKCSAFVGSSKKVELVVEPEAFKESTLESNSGQEDSYEPSTDLDQKIGAEFNEDAAFVPFEQSIEL